MPVNTEEPYKIKNFQELDSTNSYALRNIEEFSDREIIVAEKQTAGRGRLNRLWLSGNEDNAYFSFVLKPSAQINEDMPLANLTQYMSIVLCKVLGDYGVEANIKWPNDVLVDGKKIAGILSQLSIQGNNLKGMVLGVGVNLNQTEEFVNSIDQPATSLNLLLNHAVHKNTFIEKIAERFFENYELFMNKGFPFIKQEYTGRTNFIGEQVAVNSVASKETGIVKEIQDDGSLVIINKESQEKVIRIGDIIC